MAAPICSICTHPKLHAIDDALSTGGALIPTAARFGIGKSALHRHKVGCLAPKIAAVAKVMQQGKQVRAPIERAKAIASGATPNVEDVLSLTALLERLGRSLDRLEGGAASAATNELHSSHAALAGQLHRGVETVAKLRGLYSDVQPVQHEKFSVQIIIPQLPDAAPTGGTVIDVTPAGGAPQTTARTSLSLGFGDDED